MEITFFKDREDCTVEELKKKKRGETIIFAFCYFFGLMVFIISFYIYLETRLVGLSVLGGLYAVIVIILGIDSLVSKRQLSLFIYLKRQFKEEEKK